MVGYFRHMCLMALTLEEAKQIQDNMFKTSAKLV